MANKKNKKKATQKKNTAQATSSQATAQAAPKAARKAAAKNTKPQRKADAKAAKAKAKDKKNAKPGFFGRIKQYFGAVKSEMRRVTWPSKKDLVNYSVVVIASLVAVGIVIALLDVVVGEGLFLVSGLRG